MLKTATQILGELIAFETVSSDSNLAIIDYIAQRLDDAGATTWTQRDDAGTKANLFATIGPGSEGGIVLSGHTDVVPVTDQDWSSDPFEMVRRDDRLFGRGTCDMKGFIACALAMAPAIDGAKLNRPLHFAFTYDEEVGCIGAQNLAVDLKARNVKPSMAVIGEPTEMRVIEGHKGICEYTTSFTGLEGHGSRPELGCNAAEYATRFVSRLMELRPELVARAPADSRFEPPGTTVNVGSIHGGVTHNIIANRCAVEWEMRPVKEDDADFVRSTMERYCGDSLLPAMKASFADAAIETTTVGEVDGLVPMDKNAVRDLVMELTGANGADVVAFGTEAGIFQSLGMDCIVCGPGSIEQAHKTDEFVDLDQMQACLDLLEGLHGRLCR